jgi:hypothetical protein
MVNCSDRESSKPENDGPGVRHAVVLVKSEGWWQAHAPCSESTLERRDLAESRRRVCVLGQGTIAGSFEYVRQQAVDGAVGEVRKLLSRLKIDGSRVTSTLTSTLSKTR